MHSVSKRARGLVAATALATAALVTAPGAQAVAHAAARPASCSTSAVTGQPVYDSYNHYEGTIQLVWDSCTNGWAGRFNSNSNTWKSVTVHVEYEYVQGFLKSDPYGYIANYRFWSPYYHGTSCYYAEVDLVDNKGIENWAGTSQQPTGPGC